LFEKYFIYIKKKINSNVSSQQQRPVLLIYIIMRVVGWVMLWDVG